MHVSNNKGVGPLYNNSQNGMRDVLDAVLTMPARVHFDPDGKALLRELAQRHLPATVWNRPKHGFSVPLRRLFSGAWREIGDDVVSRSAQIAPFLDAGQVQALWHNPRRGHGSQRLGYTFVVLLLWLDGHRLSA